jgi:hypothetical protein
MDAISGEPDLYAQTDLTNHRLDMDWWIAALGENKKMPRVGDVIIKVTSCGMGMTVFRDERFRVIGLADRPGEVRAIWRTPDNVCARTETLHIFNMRPHTELYRTWFLID